MPKKRVFAYFDGSNFYHLMILNYGSQNVNFHTFSKKMIADNREELIAIKYFNSPMSQEENPTKYASQLKFFQKVRATPLTQLFLGRLAKRQVDYIHISCSNCGHQVSTELICPKCGRRIGMKYCHRVMEKGVDIKLATHLLLDAVQDKYDVALLISSDADFCPAIEYIVKTLHKEVVYCHFPKPFTNELKIKCSSTRLITEKIVKESKIN